MKKPPTAKQLAARKRFAAAAKAGTLRRRSKLKTNPKTRAKLDASFVAEGRRAYHERPKGINPYDPSSYVGRSWEAGFMAEAHKARKRNPRPKAPPGTRRNPVRRPAPRKTIAVRRKRNPGASGHRVETSTNGASWRKVATFPHAAEARSYAKALHASNPGKWFRVVK